MSIKSVAWSGEIACEGGPVLVANLEDFEQWRGSESLTAAQATELHYWSPFTGELPEQWQPNGPVGHQYLACANPAEMRVMLMSVVQQLWPGTRIERGQTWRAIRPDGRTLNASLSPASEYDIAIRHLGDQGVHQYGQAAAAYLWSVMPGIVYLDLDEHRNHVMMIQIEYANDDADEDAALGYAVTAGWQQPDAGEQYRVTGGPVIIAWSPNNAGDLIRPVNADDAAPYLPGKLLDVSSDASAALIWLEPGWYQSGLNYHEEGSWAVSWCRLQRMSP
jgi:hypothetical protein